MSSQPSTSKREVRLPKPELMLTRHKSSLLKRQLRKKDDSIKKISQFTKMLSPNSKEKSLNPKDKSPKQNKSPKKKVMSLKEKFEKIQKETKEFYPEKEKRRVKKKSVLLKPKHELKTVGNKRKRAVPLKGSNPSTERPPRAPSMLELVQAAEHSLDDEDLLEILTCASPVWWEDPPHIHYIEDPIYTMSPSDTEYEDLIDKNVNEDLKSSQTVIPDMSNITVPEVKRTDDRFMKKRSKLENLLGNIRNKITNTDITPKSDTICKDTKESSIKSDTERKTEDTAPKIDKINRSTGCISVVQGTQTKQHSVKDLNKYLSEEKTHEKEITKGKCIEKSNDSEEEKNTSKETKDKRKEIEAEGNHARKITTSESTEEDGFSNLQNEELLRDLENTTIPIEEMEKSPEVAVTEDLTADDGQDPFLEVNEDKIDPLASNKDTDPKHTDTLVSEKNTDPLKVDDANEGINRERVKKRPLCDPDVTQPDNINIYLVAKSKIPKTTLTESITSIETDPILFVNVKDSTDTTRVVSSQNIDTKIQLIEDDVARINPEREVTESIKDIIKETKSLDKDTNVNIDKSKTTKNIEESNCDKNIEDSVAMDVEEKTFFRPKCVKDESNNKPNETENMNNSNKNNIKEQLMVVYKMLTDDECRNKYIKTIKDDNEDDDANKTTLKDEIFQKETLDFYFKKYKNRGQKREKQKQEILNYKLDNDIKDLIAEESKDTNKNELCENCNIKETSLSIVSDVKSVKYCLKCSSIFETETCDYCDRNTTLSATQLGNLAGIVKKNCKSCNVHNVDNTTV